MPFDASAIALMQLKVTIIIVAYTYDVCSMSYEGIRALNFQVRKQVLARQYFYLVRLMVNEKLFLFLQFSVPAFDFFQAGGINVFSTLQSIKTRIGVNVNMNLM